MKRIGKLVGTCALAATVSVAAWATGTPHGAPGTPSSGAYLGVMVENLSPEAAAKLHINGGAAIENVDQDGPACQAGLKGGDVISAFNGKPVMGPDQFADMIHTTAPGSTVTLTVWRNGHSQDMKVKLGDWKQMTAVHMGAMTPRTPLSPVGTMPPQPPMAPMAAMGSMEIPRVFPLMARSGILVEPLSPQLGEYFGTPQNQGVLVRSVDLGSPGAAAGLKAGDVVVAVNNEAIHDLQDWKRALKAPANKVSLSIVRDKKPMTLVMNVPPNSSDLKGDDWESFNKEMKDFSAQMEEWQPQIDLQVREVAQLDPKEMEAIRQQVEESMKAVEPEMKRQAAEIAKHAAEWQAQSEQMRKEMEKMRPEWERQAKEMAENMKPTAKQLSDMSHEIELQMKNLQPELQKQMEELGKQWQEQQPEFQKQMEQFQKQMLEWQKKFQESFPRQM